APSAALLPRNAYGPATLIRLAIGAGFRPGACGLLFRPFGAPSRDERLAIRPSLYVAKRVLKALGRPIEVSSGLLELRATVDDAPARRPLLSVVMPVFNEARTFREIFARVAGTAVQGVDREIVIVESSSTDGSRELVREVESTPGV